MRRNDGLARIISTHNEAEVDRRKILVLTVPAFDVAESDARSRAMAAPWRGNGAAGTIT
jgi:hypothetical protein